MRSPSSSLASSSPFGASLLSKSKATPGSVDMSIFEKKGGGGRNGSSGAVGQGTTSSDYLQKTREDNPDAPSNGVTNSVSLSNCRITTDPAKLAAEQPFEMAVDLKGPQSEATGTVTFNLFCTIAKAGAAEEVKDLSSPFQATVKDGKAVVTGKLAAPDPPQEPGAKLAYHVVAEHPKAADKAESAKVGVESGKVPKPLAIWSLGAVHFGFDSSFILPSAAEKIEEFKSVLARYADAGIAIFGHADPVGDDAYNSSLSGRRAFSVFCALTKNVNGWLELSKGASGDKWDLRATQTILAHLKNSAGQPYHTHAIDGTPGPDTDKAIKAFQSDNGLTPNGIMGAATAAKLYEVYLGRIGSIDLKPEDFLGDPADKKRQWACNACGESNPVVVFSKADDDKFRAASDKRERNAKNAPNRRAVVMLFPPGAKGPGNVTFPCSAWSDGGSKCKGQFFDNADARRNPSSAERTWAKDKDTFACRFYAEIGENEAEVVVPNTPVSQVGEAADVPVNESHFDDGHFLPNLASDEFLEALAGVVDYHREHGECPLEIHPDTGSENREALEKRLKLAESIIHGDESVWTNLVQEASVRDVQVFLRYFASKGWHCDPGPVDGKSGPRTFEGIFQFQHACNHAWKMELTTDGICGPKTWNGILRTLRGLVGSDV